MDNVRQVVYTDQNGQRIVYCDLGAGVLGLGDLGTMRQCRSYLRQLYSRKHIPVTVRDSIIDSIRIESQF